jgi:predicted NBD/HSP70 family sugar kinase
MNDPVPHAVAVDIGGTSWRVAVRSARTMRVIASGPTGPIAVENLSELRRAVRTAYATTHHDETMTGLGVSFPGAVDGDGFIVAWPNRPHWLGHRLRAVLGLPPEATVSVCDDGLAAVVGESRLGAVRGTADLLVLSLGTGIGGGIVLDGRSRHPAAADARTIGHLRALGSDRLCRCGRTGCLQTALATLPDEETLRVTGLASWTDGRRMMSVTGDLARLLNISTVLLTGGLLHRPRLRQALVGELRSSGITVVTPADPGRSSLLGAFLAEEPLR